MSALVIPRSLTRLIAAFIATIAVIIFLAFTSSHVRAAHSNPISNAVSSGINFAAAANSYVVNSTLDEPAADASQPNCSSTPSGKCTLRAAIMRADFVSSPSAITVPSGVFKLNRAGYEDDALVGDLDIKHDLTIQGAGSGATIVDGNGGVTHDRVFQILSTAQNVTMSGMTIRNGVSLSSTVGVIGGGGVYMEGTGQLHLSNVNFDSNTALNGGGIYTNFSSQGGSLTLDNVTLHANTATAGGVGAGGGVFAYLPSALSQFTIQDSKVYSNTADGTGGGLFVEGNSGIQWSVQRTEMYSNTAASGGAIGNFVPLSLSDSHLHDNHVSSDGGAIETFSPLVILRTTLDANSAARFGGGIFNLEQCSSVCPQEFEHVEASTLSGNFAQYGGGIYHDGYITPGSLLTLLNSTLSGNDVGRRFHGSGTSDGGAIYVYAGQAQMLNTTVAYNNADPSSGTNNHLARGGGIFITATAQITIANSILAMNTESNGFQTGTADDCWAYSGTAGELAYDLFTTLANCSVTGPQGGNIVGQDPNLGPLQNNDGSTQTRALLTGSPAIDAGASAGCTDDQGAPLTHDQRGFVRPINGRCDMGAYEYDPNPPTITPTPTRTRTPTPTSTLTLTRTPSATPCAGKPGAPTLLKPTNNKALGKTRVLLDWSDVACAGKYKVVVKKTSKRGPKVDAKTLSVSNDKTIPLAAHTSYFWQVKACDSAGCTRSVWFEFRLK